MIGISRQDSSYQPFFSCERSTVFLFKQKTKQFFLPPSRMRLFTIWDPPAAPAEPLVNHTLTQDAATLPTNASAPFMVPSFVVKVVKCLKNSTLFEDDPCYSLNQWEAWFCLLVTFISACYILNNLLADCRRERDKHRENKSRGGDTHIHYNMFVDPHLLFNMAHALLAMQGDGKQAMPSIAYSRGPRVELLEDDDEAEAEEADAGGKYAKGSVSSSSRGMASGGKKRGNALTNFVRQ